MTTFLETQTSWNIIREKRFLPEWNNNWHSFPFGSIVLTQKKNTFESYIIYSNSLLAPSNKFFKALDKCVGKYASKGTFRINIQNLYDVIPLVWTPTTTLTFDQTLELFDNQVSYIEKIQMPLLLNAAESLARNIKSSLLYQHNNK